MTARAGHVKGLDRAAPIGLSVVRAVADLEFRNILRYRGWGDESVRFDTARLSSASGSAAKRTGTAVMDS
jgi:hypothetical protein